jgi:hypothetical protein
MTAYIHVLRRRKGWEGIQFRNETLIGVEKDEFDKKTALPESIEPDVKVVGKNNLKVYVNAENNVIGFDWRLCVNRSLLHPGRVERIVA